MRMNPFPYVPMNPFPYVPIRVLGPLNTASTPVVRCSMLNDNEKPPNLLLLLVRNTHYTPSIQKDSKPMINQEMIQEKR